MHFSNIFFLLATCPSLTSGFSEESDTSSNASNNLLRGRRVEYELPYEHGNEQQEQYVDQDVTPTRRIFVKYRRDQRAVIETKVLRARSARMHYDFKDLDTFVITVPESELQSLKDDPDVEFVHDDVPRYLQYIPESVKHRDLQRDNDDEEVVPYGIDLVQAREVWKLGARGQNVTVCVIDTGVYGGHEDLKRVAGLESIELPWDDDGVGHGTHCAGIIAAEEGNGKGVAGVAPDATIYSVKVFSDSGGFAYSSGILAAAQECVSNGASIISLSLGGPLPNVFEIWGFQQILEEKNVITVAAAGNSGNGFWSFPASYPGVISVGALDQNKTIAEFSQFNRQVDIVAPGVDVLSTFPMKAPCLICESEGYEYGTISGTSMATPHVSGVLALLKSFKPSATTEELVEALLESAEDLGETGKDKWYGNGLAQAFAAVKYLNGGSVAVSIEAQPSIESSTCNDNQLKFDVKLLTDDYANETYWELRRITDNGVQQAGAGYSDNTAVAFQTCIPKNCYTFTMYDSYGDGMCCSHGNGAYSVMVNGDIVIGNAGDFAFQDAFTFGECVEDNSTKG